MNEELMRVQRELEQEALGLGRSKYFALKAHGEEKTQPGRELIRRMVAPTAEAIREWTEEAISGKPGPGAGLGKFLSMFDPFDAAFVTCRQVLSALGGDQHLTANALNLTQSLEDLAASEEFQKQDPKGFKRLATKLARTRLAGKRHVLVRRAEQKASIARISWGISERARLGQLLLELCANATGVFTIELNRIGAKTYAYIQADSATLTWLDAAHNRCSLMSPHYLPMVVEPRAWTTPFNGGYLEQKAMRLRLLNSRRVNKNYLAELEGDPMPMVYRAVNALQATPWRINTAVLGVMQQVWDNGGTIGKLPSRDPLPMPACPWGDGPAPARDSKEWGDYNAARGRTHEANQRLVSKRRSVQAKLWTAEKFKDFEAIYFPHVLDWRGRMYPVTAHVNPQADDSGRALIEFANGVALGDEGAYYLAVHGANCFGIDKVTFDERVSWVEQHQDEILAAAFDPLAHQWWADAEDPWMFLAFCFEWAGLSAHVATGASQESFVSHLPVSWDGSCNGLQNFSAMLLDPVGGKATNLVPSDKPADIYQAVADVASAQVDRDSAKGEVNARYWQGKVTRKIAKRPTMTLPYGSGRYGFRDQLRQELDKLRVDNGKPYIEGDEFLCSLYLANVMYDALGQVVVAARQAMDWLQQVSQIASEEGLPIWWTTPAGMRVMQEYKTTVGQIVQCTLGGRRVAMTLQIDSEHLDKRKQAQGISPNFVHSLDAAHLMRTVSYCLDAGMTSFAMVHDSYGTHAGNAGPLRDLLRKAFVDQYSRNVLEKFREELKGQLSPKLAAKLPPVPPMGTLELAGVLDSEYFFA